MTDVITLTEANFDGQVAEERAGTIKVGKVNVDEQPKVALEQALGLDVSAAAAAAGGR